MTSETGGDQSGSGQPAGNVGGKLRDFQRKHDKLCPFPATAIIPTLDLRDFERLRANESLQRHRWIVVTDSWKTLVVGAVAVG